MFRKPLEPEFIQKFHEAPDPELYANSHRKVSRIVRIIWKLNVVGAELLPSEGSYIYMPTHRSQLDPFMAGIIPQRAVHFMAKQEIWDKTLYTPLERYFSKRGVFPVDRDGYPRQAYEDGQGKISAGYALGIFGEGTSRNRGAINREEIKGGAAALAVWAAAEGIDCPVVTVGLDSQWPIPRKAITAVVSEPQYPQLGGRRKDTRERFTDELTASLQDSQAKAIKIGRQNSVINSLIKS